MSSTFITPIALFANLLHCNSFYNKFEIFTIIYNGSQYQVNTLIENSHDNENVV